MTSSAAPMHWTDAYLLGYDPMDDNHREFVDCVAALQTCPDADMRAALEAFEAHAERHFGEEDRWMTETDFPGADCHADEHAAVLQSVREVLELLRGPAAADHVATARSLTAALVDWFPGHADHLDSALSHWMNKLRFGGKPIVIRRGVGQAS